MVGTGKRKPSLPWDFKLLGSSAAVRCEKTTSSSRPGRQYYCSNVPFCPHPTSVTPSALILLPCPSLPTCCYVLSHSPPSLRFLIFIQSSQQIITPEQHSLFQSCPHPPKNSFFCFSRSCALHIWTVKPLPLHSLSPQQVLREVAEDRQVLCPPFRCTNLALRQSTQARAATTGWLQVSPQPEHSQYKHNPKRLLRLC